MGLSWVPLSRLLHLGAGVLRGRQFPLLNGRPGHGNARSAAFARHRRGSSPKDSSEDWPARISRNGIQTVPLHHSAAIQS